MKEKKKEEEKEEGSEEEMIQNKVRIKIFQLLDYPLLQTFLGSILSFRVYKKYFRNKLKFVSPKRPKKVVPVQREKHNDHFTKKSAYLRGQK